MTALVEFALFAWVAISVVAVVVQLIRRARYKRSARVTESAGTGAATVDPPTIDLGERLAGTGAGTGAAMTETASELADGPASDWPGSSASPAAPATSASPTSSASPTRSASPSKDGAVITGLPSTVSIASDQNAAPDVAAAQTAPANPAPAPTAPANPAPTNPAPTNPAPTNPAPADPAPADPAPVSAEAQPEDEPEPMLAELLAGVRLPWGLLPTVDQSRTPTNDRVVLMTDEGEPGDIGVDVADELERLGFTIAPQGEDTAVATKAGRSLGLRIIPNPSDAMVEGRPRFPNAKASSVALDIWIQS